MGKLAVLTIVVTPFRQNCTLLFDEEQKKGVLIDPGGELPLILEAIHKTGITVEAAWLTHGHIDHAAAAMAAKEALGVEIIGPHEDDKPFLDDLVKIAAMYGLDEPVRNCTPDRWLKDGETVFCAGHPFTVYHCPGHAPGHVIFVSEEQRFAVMGDVLFRGTVGRTDLPGGDRDTLLKSIREKILPLGDDIIFICGHGAGSTIGEERRNNPYLQGM
ncbi:MAG: Beta-lactamase domain-containing protein [Candidatus Tokpelaia hoelldobleri]|uniref:Beta-lactamase domain-containing protein n=1 Tax=Candidatus Tokpelaia hoelldobleri TaxID=1902579 RepID=A0A1U9JVH4_9HYPH|nr:MAG: Beta-lactamase domain-containing protein [Candidatus Tokpelaia hoelldoblerii]